MNNLIFNTIRRFNIWLYKKIKKAQQASLSNKRSNKSSYHSLSPIKNANVGPYINALKWALDNSEEKEIYNIALTGPYGSGKSSILRTFKEKNENEKYVFLNISLATFKEEPPEDIVITKEKTTDQPSSITTENQKGKVKIADEFESKKVIKNNEDILRLIELSILQQIFYHEEDEKIPDSRFKKIKTFNRRTLYYNTAFCLIAFIFGINLFYPEQIQGLLKIRNGKILSLVFHWISLAVFSIVLVIALFRSVRFLYSLRISKFKFQEAEIEIDKNISKSILNNHLDEILYFFEVTPYSVVLIEDLDRFRQAEIFTKLRELNQLINNSKKIKDKKVVFIYAVRDEMFQNKDRTKFFDFIIPVIPVINSSNSKEKLADININEKHGVSPEIIDEISLFIDDMRLLYNITNEFKVYSALLDKGLPRDNLFAILVYKNIYPEDFVALGNNDGKLYGLLNKKPEYIKEHVEVINQQINQNKAHLSELKLTMLKESDELRRMYVSKFVDETDGFTKFNFAGNECNIWQASTAESFEFFKKGNFNYKYYVHQGGYYYLTSTNASFQFQIFQTRVDPNETYGDRLKKIEDVINGLEERLKQENQALEKQKAEMRHIKLKDIFSDKRNIGLLETKTLQDQLLSLLLRSGHIGEDYLDYISLFYEGSLTKVDHAFLLTSKVR